MSTTTQNNIAYDSELEETLDVLFHKNEQVELIFINAKATFISLPELSHFIVGTRWLQFSEIMPLILSIMVQKASSNQERAKLAKTLYEELGEGNCENIHSNLYLNALLKSGLDTKSIESANVRWPPTEIYSLISEFQTASSAKILGMSMGLELIAQENISMLALAFRLGAKNEVDLRTDLFFSIHFENEINHIKENLELYFNLTSVAGRHEYIEGVNRSMQFWKQFWSNNIFMIQESKHKLNGIK